MYLHIKRHIELLSPAYALAKFSPFAGYLLGPEFSR